MAYESDNVTTVITLPCLGCGERSSIVLPRAQVARWQGGENIADVWPHWTPADRELLISGIHDDCWKKMFPKKEATK